MAAYNCLKEVFNKVFLIYLRKSRKDGDESVEEVLLRHFTIIQEWAERVIGYRISEDNIYREVVSGETITDRPEMQKMLKRCETEDIYGVIVVEPQRLTRGDYGDIDRIVKTLQFSDTLVCTPTYTFDLNDKRDKKSFEMDLLRGADYLDYIKEILFRGRKQSAFEGKFAGSIPPYGYDKVKLQRGYTLTPNAEAAAVKEVFRMYAEGNGLWTIAHRLNALGYKPKRCEMWKDYNVKQMLTMEVYIGKICFDKHKTITKMVDGELVKKSVKNPEPVFYKGLHPAIIDEDIFYKVQEKLKKNSAKCVPKSQQLKNPLSGLVRCKYHHNEVLVRKGGPGDATMRGACGMYGCSNVFAYMVDIEKAVIDKVKDDLSDYEYILDNYATEKIKQVKDYQSMIDRIDKQIAKYKKGLLNAQRKYNDEEYTTEEYYDLKRDYETDIAEAQAEKQKVIEEKENDNYDRYTRLVPNMKKVLDKYWTLTPEDKNRLLKSMIDRVYYAKEKKGRDVPIELEIIYKI